MSKKVTPRRLAENEASAKLVATRISPQKLNLIAGLIRGKSIVQAMDQLHFSRKRAAQDVQKLLMSAVANAETNHGLDVDGLYVAEAYVGKSFVMKRFRARARGRAGKIMKPFSQMEIVLRQYEGNA
jgi:large subunit ribosomal protein L22